MATEAAPNRYRAVLYDTANGCPLVLEFLASSFGVAQMIATRLAMSYSGETNGKVTRHAPAWEFDSLSLTHD